MDLEQVRKEHKKELSQRDDESEKMRCNTTKKVKGKNFLLNFSALLRRTYLSRVSLIFQRWNVNSRANTKKERYC